MIIKRVAPFSAACCLGLLSLFSGFLVAVFMLVTLAEVKNGGIPNFGTSVLLAVILAPLFYGISGFISGLVLALLYNLTAGWYGGLIVETESDPKNFSPKKVFERAADKVVFIKEPN